MQIYITGAATTQFGELWDLSPKTLATRAVLGAMKEARVEPRDLDALFVGNMLSGMLGRQEHLGAFFADALKLPVPAFKIEGACASGGLAVHVAVNSVLSGQYKTVVVLGVEKMTDHKPEDVAEALTGAGSDEERASGATFPALYALLAQSHMQAFGTTPEDLAGVAVKNHYHASFNPNAQFGNLLTVEQVLQSSMIASPLHLLDCSPISDGAAAIVITSHKPAKNTPCVEVVSSSVATDTLSLAKRASLTELKATQRAAKKAYEVSGVAARDIDVAEVHDCFTIAEILAMGDLGFFEIEKAAANIRAGKTTLGTDSPLVVNPSGGLKGCGHPVGATGVKQIVELVEQLQGRAGKRQVAKARYGLAHNVGGSGATAVVHILKGSL
jgi:acetyl-CoA C-acetyltransferase